MSLTAYPGFRAILPSGRRFRTEFPEYVYTLSGRSGDSERLPSLYRSQRIGHPNELVPEPGVSETQVSDEEGINEDPYHPVVRGDVNLETQSDEHTSDGSIHSVEEIH